MLFGLILSLDEGIISIIRWVKLIPFYHVLQLTHQQDDYKKRKNLHFINYIILMACDVKLLNHWFFYLCKKKRCNKLHKRVMFLINMYTNIYDLNVSNCCSTLNIIHIIFCAYLTKEILSSGKYLHLPQNALLRT